MFIFSNKKSCSKNVFNYNSSKYLQITAHKSIKKFQIYLEKGIFTALTSASPFSMHFWLHLHFQDNSWLWFPQLVIYNIGKCRPPKRKKNILLQDFILRWQQVNCFLKQSYQVFRFTSRITFPEAQFETLLQETSRE